MIPSFLFAANMRIVLCSEVCHLQFINPLTLFITWDCKIRYTNRWTFSAPFFSLCSSITLHAHLQLGLGWWDFATGLSICFEQLQISLFVDNNCLVRPWSSETRLSYGGEFSLRPKKFGCFVQWYYPAEKNGITIVGWYWLLNIPAWSWYCPRLILDW